jgi:hypothetical protein
LISFQKLAAAAVSSNASISTKSFYNPQDKSLNEKEKEKGEKSKNRKVNDHVTDDENS